jgi:hypothetical protein
MLFGVLAATPDLIAEAKVPWTKARTHVWILIEDTTAGFPWLVIAGKTPWPGGW